MQSQSPKAVWVVIAAYNEAPVIAGLVADVTRTGYCAVVVDDGSNDGTANIAADAGAFAVKHPINLGQGAALQTGLVKHCADFALGSCFLGRSLNRASSRRMLLRAATWFTCISHGIRITYVHNELRVMTPHGAGSLYLRQNHMAHASEFLHQVASSGLKYMETLVTIEYTKYSLAKGRRSVTLSTSWSACSYGGCTNDRSFLLITLLFGILLYAAITYRQAPAVGFLSMLAAVARLYFVGFPRTSPGLQHSLASAAALTSSSTPGWSSA
jgi:hypothetical protein